MSLVQVVDVGTTNIKSGVVNKKGEIVAQSSQELDLEHPEPAAAEHNPKKLFEAFCNISRQANKGFRSEVNYLVLTGYLFGFLPLDKDRNPITGMITLLDERPKSIMGELERQFPLEELYKRTGCPPLFIYSFAKILWLKEKKPNVFDKAEYFADLKSFLIEKLTGKFLTELSVASATQLYNVQNEAWDKQVLSWLGLDKNQLPELRAGSEKIASLDVEVGEMLGVKGGTILLPGLYDGGAMILGMGGYEENDAICNLGTTAMLRKSSSEPVLDRSNERRLQTYSLLPGRWAIGGSLNNAGVALKWFRDNLTPNKSYKAIVRAAREVEPGSKGLIFLPFLTGERDPRIGNLSSGLFFGLKNYHSKQHMARAIMEGVVYSLGFVLKAMEEREIDVSKIVIGGSGSQSDLWPQLVADILGRPVERSLSKDSTLIGGAMLGYHENGDYSSLEEATNKMVREGKEFTPEKRNCESYRKWQEFFYKLVSNVKPLFEEHSSLV